MNTQENLAVEELSIILNKCDTGHRENHDQQFIKSFQELKDRARYYIRRETNPTIQATELVNEAWIRVSTASNLPAVEGQNFIYMACAMMRRILVDRARKRLSDKRGSGQIPLDFDEELNLATEESSQWLVDLHESLKQLKKMSERQHKTVELKFFMGLNNEEIAQVLGVSTMTVKRDWKLAKAWIHRELNTPTQ